MCLSCPVSLCEYKYSSLFGNLHDLKMLVLAWVLVLLPVPLPPCAVSHEAAHFQIHTLFSFLAIQRYPMDSFLYALFLRRTVKPCVCLRDSAKLYFGLRRHAAFCKYRNLEYETETITCHISKSCQLNVPSGRSTT